MGIFNLTNKNREKNDLVYKWRVKAMLDYIRHMAEIGRTQNDIITVIDGYLKFVEEL